MKFMRMVLGTLMALVMFAGTVLAQEVIVGPWEKASAVDGIVGYLRTNSKAPVKEFKAVGVVNAPVAGVENLIRDQDSFQRALFMAKKYVYVDVPGYKPTPDTLYAYLRQDAPWPVEDRDGVGRMDFSIAKATNTVVIKCQLVMPEYPKVKGVTRMDMCDMKWVLKPIDATHTEVTYQNLFNPGGSVATMPRPVVDYVLKYCGVLTIKNLRKVAKEDKFQHAKTIITQTPLAD